MAEKAVEWLLVSREWHMELTFVDYPFPHITMHPTFKDPCPQGSKTKLGNLFTMSARSSQVASSASPLLH